MGFNPGGSGGIAGASDVALSGVQDNEVLTYDSASSKWQNDVTSGGAPTYANLPSGTTVSVYYISGTWPARPTSRTDITVQWLDFVGDASIPSGLIESVDVIYHDVGGSQSDQIAARWTGDGVVDGTVISTGNVNASGNAFGAGTDWTYSISGAPTAVYAGDGFRVSSSTTTDISRIDATLQSSETAIRMQCMLTASAYPNEVWSAVGSRNSSAWSGRLYIGNDGRCWLNDGTEIIQSTTPMTAVGDRLLVDMVVALASAPTTSNGRLFYRIRNLTNTSWNTTGEFFWDSGYTRNVGTQPMTAARYGKLANTTIPSAGMLFEQLGAEGITVNPSDTSEQAAKAYFADAPV